MFYFLNLSKMSFSTSHIRNKKFITMHNFLWDTLFAPFAPFAPPNTFSMQKEIFPMEVLGNVSWTKFVEHLCPFWGYFSSFSINLQQRQSSLYSNVIDYKAYWSLPNNCVHYSIRQPPSRLVMFQLSVFSRLI